MKNFMGKKEPTLLEKKLAKEVFEDEKVPWGAFMHFSDQLYGLG